MDFVIPEELKMLQATVRRFMEEEVIPLEIKYRDGYPPDDTVKELQSKVKNMGLWSMFVPEEFGGGGINELGRCLVQEETAKTILAGGWFGGSVFGGNPDVILFECNDEQKEKYLYPVMRGEKRPCFAQTEPNAGSDPASMETTAVKDGDSWVLNGTKIFISSAMEADFAMVLAVNDKEKKGRGGITTFLVDRDTPGYKATRYVETMGGDREVGEIVLDNCVVPAKNVLGQVGLGFQLGQKWLGHGRMGMGASSVGIAERALKMATSYAKQRVTFGQPIASRQAIQWMLADSAVDIHAARWMTYHGAWKTDQGEDTRQEISIVKLFATEMASRVVDRAIQIHGGMGYSKELCLEAFYRQLRGARIYEGTSEIHRFVIARNLLRD